MSGARLSSARRGCGGVVAAGDEITAYSSLTGADVEAKLETMTLAHRAAFGPGTNSWSNFDTIRNGIRAGMSTTRRGIIGTGIGSTIFTQTALSSTRSAEVPAQGSGQTNQIYLMYFEQNNTELRCFTLQGTDQGHFYNGIRLDSISNGRFANIKAIGAGPGNWHFPPGETFVWNDFGGINNTFWNLECDGRMDGATGIGDGATAFGQNSFVGGKWSNCYAHHFPWSAAFALWQGSGTINMYGCRGDANRTHLNLERLGGEIGGQRPACTLNIYDFEFGTYISTVNGYGQDIFLANDQGSTKVNFYRPRIKSGRTVPSGRPVGQCFVYNPTLEQGNPNLQKKADVKAYDANGVDISASFFAWQNAGQGN